MSEGRESRSAAETGASPRRSVATRVLASFLVMLIAFAVTASWSIAAQRRTVADSEELAKGYVPVALKLGQLRATQAAISTIVDGLPDERDPVSARLILGTLASARHAKLLETKAAALQLAEVGSDDASVEKLSGDLDAELDGVEAALDADKGGFERLFVATASGDKDSVNREIVEVGAVEHDADKRLHGLADRLATSMDAVSAAAKARGARAIYALIALSLVTLAVAVAVSVHVRRLLGPLAKVTERAQAVARGDLTPREPPGGPGEAPDEIGELAATFERMVAGLASSQRAALESERLAAIGKMAAHVTHEIRNPLSSIGLNVELLEEELEEGVDKDEAKALLSSIRREVERLEQLSEEYLRVARLPSPRMEADDVAQAVRDVAGFSRKEMERAGCTLAMHIEGDAEGRVPPALFDEAQLRQALLNLLRNAREAMPEGGTIDVTVRAEGMSVAIRIDDRGAGIPEEIRAQVFDPFFSTKGEGTGLGLAITRQIVEAHGGSLTCEGREGGGTSFRIALPIAPARASALPSPSGR